jgi:hypothetical protein
MPVSGMSPATQAVAPSCIRCTWAAGADAVMQNYHDTAWGVPQHADRALFELLT